MIMRTAQSFGMDNVSKIKTLLQGSTLSYPSVSSKFYYHCVKSSLTYTLKYYDRIEKSFDNILQHQT